LGRSEKAEGGKQKLVVSGQWSVVSGQWSVVSGQWSVVRVYDILVSVQCNSGYRI